MATLLYTDVKYYGPHFDSMAKSWRPFESAMSKMVDQAVNFIRNERSKRTLRELPDHLLEDIGVRRSEL